MPKRKSTIKKKILYPVLLGLVTLSSTAMAEIHIGLYNGATKHYRKGKERNSPVLGAAGLATGLVENIRFFGPFTPAYKEDGSRDYAGDTSDNPSWQMTKILFPSTGGDLASEANFETSFGNNVDKVQSIVPLLSFVNDLREGKDVNVEALKNALFSTLKERPPYDSRKEQADLEKVKKEVPKIQATTKADFIKALRGLDIDPNLKKEMIGYATNKYKPKNKPNDLDAVRLEELQGLLIGVADQWISTTIQKKQRQEDERFKQRFFRETLTPLIESIQQAVENEKDSIFPAYTTEQLIETFFSHKFNTQKDIDNLIEATPDDIVDPAVPFVSEPVSAEKILEHDVLDMDDVLALSALEMAGAPVPYQSNLSPISNGEKVWYYDRATDHFKKDIRGFSDCVDVMPRHMTNMLLYNQKTQAFNMTPLLEQQKKFAEGSPQFKRLQNAIEFFTKYQSPMMANNGYADTRSWWNRVIADLNFDGVGPKVDYVEGDNELDTGHINMLRMFQNVFSLDLDPFPVLEVVNEADPEKEKEALLQILQKLGLEVAPFPILKVQEEATPEQEQEVQAKLAKDILSWKTKARENIQKKFEENRINWILNSFHKVFSFMNPDFVYDFKPENLSWSPKREDVMGDITVLVKKSKTSFVPLYSFIMHQKDGHSVVQNIAYPKNQAALEIEIKPAAIEPLTAEESLWLLFPQLVKTKITEPLYQMMPRLLADNDSKIEFISQLKTMDWKSMPLLATQEIAGFLSNILPTLGWDDPDTLRRITGSIFGVILDKDKKLNEALPQEVREAFFRQTQALEFEGVINPNLAKVLPYFQNDVLKTSDLKIRFIEFLNGLNWVEVTEDDASKMTGLLSRTLDLLSLDTPESNVRFIGALSGIDWSKISEDNTSKIKRLLSTTLDTFSRDDKFTDLMLAVFLDKTGRLKDVPQMIQDAFFDKVQILFFKKEIPDSFVHVLPHFKNNVLRRPDQTLFLESLSRIDWKEVSEENVQELAGLLSKVLSPQISSPGNASVRMPHMPPKRVIQVGGMRGLPQRNTTAIVNVFLDKDGRFKYVPEKIQEAFFTRTQSLTFEEAIKPNFARILPYFQKDMLTTPDLKIKFVDSLRDMEWKEVSEGDILGIAGMLSKILDAFPWDNPAALASSIVNVLLDKTGALNALLPREIQETFFNKTRSLGFSGAITSDFFLGLSKILPRFVQAKDTIKQLTISGGEGKIEEFPESLNSLTLNKVKVGTVALATLPSLNNLSFEDVTLDRLVIDPAHSQLKMTTKTLSVSEIQGLENLEVFQKETLSSKDPFFNEITGLEAIKFTNPNHKIETLSFEGDTPYGKRKVHPSRIEGLKNLPHLQVLDLSGSQAVSIEDFESLAQLKKVKLSRSLFGAHHFSEKHQTLEELYIHDLGDLQEIPGFEHLTQLKKLGFSGASLETLKFFPFNASLEEVEVKGSEIGEVQGLEHLTQLKKLAFTDEAGTYASVLDSLTFSASNAKLEELSVVRSYVNSIQGLEYLKGLKKLDLTGAGNLTALTFEDELPNLRVITASGNPHIEEINGLDKLPNLESLVLLDTESLKGLRFTGSNEHLKFIYLANSGVAVLEGLDTLPNLETLLALDVGKLRSVRLSPVNAKLKDIELSGSRLTSIEGLEKLPALETLKLGTLSNGPKKLTLPEDVKFIQLWGGRMEITRVKRPVAVKTDEEGD